MYVAMYPSLFEKNRRTDRSIIQNNFGSKINFFFLFPYAKITRNRREAKREGGKKGNIQAKYSLLILKYNSASGFMGL